MTRLRPIGLTLLSGVLLSACTSRVGGTGARPDSVLSPARTAATADSTALSGMSLAVSGVWQLLPEFAAGWTDAYQFFADGHFTFHTSEMDCGARLQSSSGQWRIEDSTLVLMTEQRVTLAGGHFEEAMGSCASDSALTDATPHTDTLTSPEITRLPFSPPTIMDAQVHDFRSDGPGMVSAHAVGLRIGNTNWYKMREDPAAYP